MAHLKEATLDAVVRIGGKQYRMHEGTVLNVATIDAEPGSQVELNDVLLVSDNGTVMIGAPNVDGAVVVADVVEHGKGKKVINFKYKAKVRYRRKRGHRQPFTTLSVREIRIGGASSPAAAPRRRTRAAPAEDEPAAEAPETPTAEATETPAAEAPKAAPRRRTRAAPKTDTPATEGDAAAPRPRRRRTTSSESESQD
jgi:large subunit ribosomal protein L21